MESSFNFITLNPKLHDMTTKPCVRWNFVVSYSLTSHGLIRVVPTSTMEACTEGWSDYSTLHFAALFSIVFCLLHQVSNSRRLRPALRCTAQFYTRNSVSASLSVPSRHLSLSPDHTHRMAMPHTPRLFCGSCYSCFARVLAPVSLLLPLLTPCRCTLCRTPGRPRAQRVVAVQGRVPGVAHLQARARGRVEAVDAR